MRAARGELTIASCLQPIDAGAARRMQGETPPMSGELQDRTCVVTGGARGIGASICSVFAREGARVIVLDFDQDAANETAEELIGQGCVAFPREADVRDERSIRDAAETVLADFGRIDVLVNNAGNSLLGPTFSYPLSAWDDSIAVMQTGVFLCSREFGRAMRAKGGSIINISSINGLTGFPGRLAYSAAKAAVNSMTQVLAVEWGRYGIRVNAIAPGINHTRMLDDAVEAGLIDPDAYKQHIPLRRFGRPTEMGEMAEAVLFLASDRASYVTGQIIAVDGGWTAFGWVPWDGDADSLPSVGFTPLDATEPTSLTGGEAT